MDLGGLVRMKILELGEGGNKVGWQIKRWVGKLPMG